MEEGSMIFGTWGVFNGDGLLAYAGCIRDDGAIAIDCLTSKPAGVRLLSSCALISTILRYRAKESGLTVRNGYRPISHNTNIQDFLLRFGFRKEYCALMIIYRPLLALSKSPQAIACTASCLLVHLQ